MAEPTSELESIPFLNVFSDAQQRADAAANARDRQRAIDAWNVDLDPERRGYLVDYQGEGTRDEYGDLMGGPSQLESYGDVGREQRVALDALGGLIDSGGYTDADAMATRANRMGQLQAQRGRDEAIMQQMQARGMAGSGADIAARLQGTQNMTNASAMGDAALQQAAMQRALGAMQSYGALGSQVYNQGYSRRGALDAYNQQNVDWRRGREQRNTAWENQTQSANSQSRQNADQMRLGRAAGQSNTLMGFGNERRADTAAQRQVGQDQLAVIGSVGEGITGGIGG